MGESFAAAAGTGLSLSSMFGSIVTHGALFLGAAALAVTTGIDLHGAAIDLVEPVLS